MEKPAPSASDSSDGASKRGRMFVAFMAHLVLVGGRPPGTLPASRGGDEPARNPAPRDQRAFGEVNADRAAAANARTAAGNSAVFATSRMRAGSIVPSVSCSCAQVTW